MFSSVIKTQLLRGSKAFVAHITLSQGAFNILFRNSTFYTKSHEWISIENNVGRVGITDFAQNALGEVTYVELPDLDNFEKGDSLAYVESVKATSDIYAPVTGEVTNVNDDLNSEPELLNNDPEGKGWMWEMTISDESQLDELLNDEDYKSFCESESH